MGTIRVEYVPIQQYNLGLLGLDHIQIVFQDETSFVDKQDHWFVLEGIQEGGLFSGTLGVQGNEFYTPLSAANAASGDALVDKIGTPESRGSRTIFSSPQALPLWDAMSNYGSELDLQAHPYTGVTWPFGPSPTINSSSAVATMLWSVGIDINLVMPFGLRLSPGTHTLLGTTQVDEIALGGNFSQVAGGFGQDVLRGSSSTSGVDKLYGGNDDDQIYWSKGLNVIHGGEPNLSYVLDGLDTIDYSGVGQVTFYSGRHIVEHKTPNFVTVFEGGGDELFSIEKVSWLRGKDVVTVREGIDIIEVPIEFNLDDSTNGGTGDELIFTNSTEPLIINVVDDTFISIQTISNSGQDAGIWARSAETITGSSGDDLIYAGATVTLIDGDKGDDLLDGRLAIPYSGQSPLGYDVELFGNEGDDTIVSGTGRTIAAGGQGSDIFVLSAMGVDGVAPEFVIADADADDKIYLPYNFFKTQRDVFEGSDLFQISGAAFKIDENNTISYFEWGPRDGNETEGYIEFSGSIRFEMDGADLLISVFQGYTDSYIIDYGPGEPPGPEVIFVVSEGDTKAVIRVADWVDGDLGISFPIAFDFNVFAEHEGVIEDYPGWDTAIHDATGASRFAAPLDERPDTHLPAELRETAVAARVFSFSLPTGSEGDDVISVADWSRDEIAGLGGNDNISGSTGGDRINGGTGDDIMAGGRGNDTYYVDTDGDQIIEALREGFDRVYSSIDYNLGENVEHLTLTGNALSGHGNSLRNTIVGNPFDNMLTGGAGDDTLAGNEGNDHLSGGDGSDGYVYENGDGNDLIIDAPGSTDQDVIVLAGNYTAGDVRFFRDPTALNDLILRFAGGGSITVRDHFNGSAIESIEFLTGEVWTTTDVEARAAAAEITSNVVPDALPDNYIYAGTGSFTVNSAAFLDNDSDSDGDTLQIVSVTDVSEGNVIVDASGNIQITPVSNASAVNFRYVVSDGRGGTSSALAEIALFPNRPPQITSGQLSPVIEDVVSAGRIIASDPDSDSLVYRLKAGAGPQLGTVVFGEDGNFDYRPAANASGTDAFTIEVTDTLTGTVEYTFNPAIEARNDNPVAQADLLGTAQGGSTTVISSAALLGNDSDIDGDPLQVVAVSGAVGGTVTLTANGDIRFVAANNFVGAGSFTYSLSDGQGGLAQASASLTILENTPTDPHLFIGTNRQDALTGTNDADAFYGKNGNDILNGLGGDDVFHVRGKAGLDKYNGGSGYDTIRGGAANDTIRVTSSQSNLKGIEKIDGGVGKRDNIVTTSGDDNLNFSKIAITGIEQIKLGAGNDSILGSKGNDTILGGSGQDTFKFKTASGQDVILDFEIGRLGTGGDKIDLRGTGIHNYRALFENTYQSGNDTVISLDHNNSITLKNVTTWHLSFEHFLL